ncbi:MULTISPECIES: KGK domain-containing protein [Nostocales]|uniref:KGK domain-containing protein n=1 Tax=Tolypothrix campylonemoides VB511288_2 TaxID=3232311 RepID=A0ABW8XM80_9CYAN
MNDEFETLESGEIVSLNHQKIARHLNLPSNGFPDLHMRVEQIQELIVKKINITDNRGQSLFDEGIICEVMKFEAKGWQQGKVRARLFLEFCPNEPEPSFEAEIKPVEPESPLDDLRQRIQQE